MRWRDIEIGFIKKNRRERFVVVFFDLFFIFFMFGLPRSLPFPLFLVFGVVCLLDCLSQKRLDLKDGSVFGVEDLVVLEFAFLVCFFFLCIVFQKPTHRWPDLSFLQRWKFHVLFGKWDASMSRFGTVRAPIKVSHF